MDELVVLLGAETVAKAIPRQDRINRAGDVGEVGE
jgi:hypothetical protein